MNNIPSKIYLQIGEDCDCENFNKLHDVSWCKDKINENDIEYIRLVPEKRNSIINIKRIEE